MRMHSWVYNIHVYAHYHTHTTKDLITKSIGNIHATTGSKNTHQRNTYMYMYSVPTNVEAVGFGKGVLV